MQAGISCARALVVVVVFLIVSFTSPPTVASGAVGYFTQIQPATLTHTGTDFAQLTSNNWAQATANALRAESLRAESAYSQILSIAQVTDLYTLNGPVGTTVPVTMTLEVDYTMSNATATYWNKMYTELTQPGGGLLSDIYERYNHASSGGPQVVNDPDVDLSFTINWTVGQSHEIRSAIKAYSSLSAHTDASSTGTVNFVLPDGYSMTSQLGWTPIPEPAALSLAAAAAALLLARRR